MTIKTFNNGDLKIIMELPPTQRPATHNRAFYGIHRSQSLKLLSGKYRAGARAAIGAATSGLERNFIHGCALLRGSKILSVGRNYDYKTHPNGSGPFTTLHAEINALANLDYEAKPDTIVIVRLNTNGYIRSSLPCPNCLQQLVLGGIKNIVYSEDLEWKMIKTTWLYQI